MNVRAVALLPVLVAALALVPPALAPPPARGLFVPGESLGGVRLGMTKAEVMRVWGKRHGVCRTCPRTTWYFNRRPFAPQGAGVAFERGRAVHVFTHWRPEGWRTIGGLALGAEASDVPGGNVVVEDRTCVGYGVLVVPAKGAQSVYYLYDGELWGFGLTRPGANPCL